MSTLSSSDTLLPLPPRTQSPMEYTKKVDGSKGLKTTVELCDANERSVRATVFLDADGALAFELGSVVALRSARVSIWQGVVGLALSVGGVVIAPDVPQAAALRSAAVAIVEQAGANEGGSGALMAASSHSATAPSAASCGCVGVDHLAVVASSMKRSCEAAGGAVKSDDESDDEPLGRRRRRSTNQSGKRRVGVVRDEGFEEEEQSAALPLLRGAGAAYACREGDGVPSMCDDICGTPAASRPHDPDLYDFVGSCST